MKGDKRIWWLGLALAGMLVLMPRMTEPFWGHHEFNGVFYGMMAKNYMRYGLAETKGAQITTPQVTEKGNWSLHTHHPATYPLLLYGWFLLWGAGEWQARLLSIVSSGWAIAGLAALNMVFFKKKEAGLGVLAVIFTPLYLYFGSLPVFEALLLPLAAWALYFYWTRSKHANEWWSPVMVFASVLLDWPGYWLGLWLLAYELVFLRRRKMLIRFVGAVVLASVMVLLHQRIATGTWLSELLAVGERRLGATGEPFTITEWLRLLATRTKAFYGLALLVFGGLSLVVVKNMRKEKWGFLVAVGMMGITHIVVFRNISWYHDYMLYHLIPWFSLVAGAGLAYFVTRWNRWGVGIFLVLVVVNFVVTWPFTRALAQMQYQRECYEMGLKIKSGEQTEFRMNEDKARLCGPVMGYYGEIEFKIEVE